VATVVGPTIAEDDARETNAPPPWNLRRLIAGVVAITLALAAGCSSNSRSIGDAPLPASVTASNSQASFSSNPQVTQILTSSCFDCHSEEGTAAWYVKFSPSYWFSGSARKNLNFTEWNDYDARRRTKAIEAIGRVVNRGEMPPWDYTVFHPAAELSNQQKDLVSQWAARSMEVLPAH
jgi:Haem-binding domain